MAKKRNKHSFILTFLIVGLFACFTISFISVYQQIAETKKEIAAVEELKKEQEAKNEELQKVLDSGDIDEYVEKIARDKLGYVKPGERVYYNSSAND